MEDNINISGAFANDAIRRELAQGGAAAGEEGFVTRLADLNSAHMGGIIARKPSMAEVDLGAKEGDFVLASETATISPFGSNGPEVRDLMGHTDPRLQVTVDTPEHMYASQQAVLYGDVADAINKVVAGGSKLVSKAVDAVDWDKLSPAAKAALGLGAGVLGAKAVSSMIPNMMMYKLGRSVARDGADGDDGSSRTAAAVVAPATDLVTKTLVNGSVPVRGEVDEEGFSHVWTVLPNSFIAGAYAIGTGFDGRSSAPSFGLLGNDPSVTKKALRGLRCPKLTVHDGKIFRSSAQYAVPLPLLHMRTVLKHVNFDESAALAGGALGDAIANVAKDVGTTILTKVKDWAKGLFDKLGGWLKKLFTPHTHWPAKHYSIAVTPALVAARLWGLLKVIPEKEVNTIEDSIMSDVKQMLEQEKFPGDKGKARDSSREKRAKFEADAQSRWTSILTRLENLRQKYHIPSEMPWNDLSWYDVRGETARSVPRVLKQYAPRAAQHVYQLQTVGSGTLMDIFGTRNPAILFADPDALQQDIEAAAGESAAMHSDDPASITDPTGAMAQAASNAKAAVNGSSVAPVAYAVGEGGAQGVAGQKGATDPVAGIQFTSNVSDPDALAAILATTNGGTLASIPNAWMSQLPKSIVLAHEMRPDIVDDPGAIVGDPYVRRGFGRPVNRMAPAAGHPALVAAGKTLLRAAPYVLAFIPWDKVGGWFKKNGAKADVIKSAAGGSQAVTAAAVANSGGFLAAFSGAVKTFARSVGKAAKSVFSAIVRNPKLAIAAGTLAACYVVGASYLKRSNDQAGSAAFSKLLELLVKCLEELGALGVLTQDQVTTHRAAIMSIAQDGGDITESQSQELQTVAILAESTYLDLGASDGSAAAKYPALAEFHAACSSIADKTKVSLGGIDDSSLEAVCTAVIEEAKSLNASGDSGIAQASTVDPSVQAAVAAAGGHLIGTPASGTGAPSAAAESSHAGTTVNTQEGEASPSQDLSASEAAAPEAVINGMDASQLAELSSIAEAGAALSDSEINAEEDSGVGQIGEAVSQFLLKYGLPAAAAGGITASVIALIRSKKKAKTSGMSQSFSDAEQIESWWREVCSKVDPNYTDLSRGTYTAVAI